MALRPLPPLRAVRFDLHAPSYRWNETEGQPFADSDDRKLEKRSRQVSGRAGIALTLAIGEWVCALRQA